MYLVPEINRQDRQKNLETLKLAEAIRAKRLVELRNSEYGFKSPFKEDSNFYEYYVAMCNERFKSDTMGNRRNWRSALKHLLKYESRLKHLQWKDIDRDFITGFKEFSKMRLAHGRRTAGKGPKTDRSPGTAEYHISTSCGPAAIKPMTSE